MTRRMLIQTRTFHNEQGERQLLEYYLLTDEFKLASGAVDLYGAEIRLYGLDNDAFEQNALHGLTPIGPKIVSLLFCLWFKRVLPGELRKVVGRWKHVVLGKM